MEDKEIALRQFLKLKQEDTVIVSIGRSFEFIVKYGTYWVLLESERNTIASLVMKEWVWAMSPDFNCLHIGGHDGENELECFKVLQRDVGEKSNFFLYTLINDFDVYCMDAIERYGYGHFLNNINGEEYKQNNFYIYRR